MIYLDCKVQIAILIADNAPITILAEYLHFANVFSKKFAAVLQENIEINTHTINLEKGKYPPYGLIYSLRSVKLENLKIYIETNLANSFI